MRNVLLLSILFCLSPGLEAQQSDLGGKMLVSTAWLAEHLNDPGIVVVHIAGLRRDYLSGHVPGARFLWPTDIAMSNPDLSYQLLGVTHLDSIVECLGISNNTRVILCGVNGNVSPVARVFLTMEYLGLSGQVAILDGGFDVWKSEGRPTTSEVPTVARASFTPKLKSSVFVDAAGVQASIKKEGVSIIDARAPGFYDGTTPNGMPRSGHIPGAHNIFYTTLVDSLNKMLGTPTMEGMFSKAGVNTGDRVIAYCHVGQTASLVYFAARLLGHEASLYDGSFEDWSGRTDLPVELPPKKDASK